MAESLQDPDLAPARTPRDVELGRLHREAKDHPILEPVLFVPAEPIVDREYEDDDRDHHDMLDALGNGPLYLSEVERD